MNKYIFILCNILKDKFLGIFAISNVSGGSRSIFPGKANLVCATRSLILVVSWAQSLEFNRMENSVQWCSSWFRHNGIRLIRPGWLIIAVGVFAARLHFLLANPRIGLYIRLACVSDSKLTERRYSIFGSSTLLLKYCW